MNRTRTESQDSPLPPPRITVLMAVFNGERYVREAIDSILQQSYKDFEFLIVEDASRDRTREIIDSYSDGRIRVVENRENLGLTRSLNRGLRLSRGEFIARQDADDISEPDRLRKQLEFLQSHPHVALVGSWYREIDREGRVIGANELPTDSTDICWAMLFFCPFVHSAVMFRKNPVLEQIGYYNEGFRYSQDYDLWNRITQQFAAANLGEYLVRLRTSPWSMTATYGEATQEGPRLRLAQFERMAGPAVAGGAASGEWFRRIYLLLFEDDTEIEADAILDTARKALALAPAFCRQYDLKKAARIGFRSRLKSRIGRRLVYAAQRCFVRQDYRTARRLLIEAARTWPPVVLTKTYAAALLGLLGNSRYARCN